MEESVQYEGMSSFATLVQHEEDIFDPANFNPVAQMVFAGAPEGVFQHENEGQFTILEESNPEA